jgi:hypothetical protein
VFTPVLKIFKVREVTCPYAEVSKLLIEVARYTICCQNAMPLFTTDYLGSMQDDRVEGKGRRVGVNDRLIKEKIKQQLHAPDGDDVCISDSEDEVDDVSISQCASPYLLTHRATQCSRQGTI